MLEAISNAFSGILREMSGKGRISEKNIDDAVDAIKNALLDADVNLRVVRRFLNRTIEEAKGERVLKSVSPGQQFIKIVHDRLVNLLGDEKQELELKNPDVVSVILMCGLQGSGKTTTAAKLALLLKNKAKRPLLVAADLARPAAVEQLSTLGQSIQVPVFALPGEKNPRKVVEQALKEAKKQQYNVVIIDTAGRLQIDEALMKELKDVRDLAKPDETLLVADSMTGQSAVEIAQSFNAAIGLSGIILTKFDSDTRGGAALSLKSITEKPIKFIGTGEKITDLEVFYPERIASRILGMGDIVSLVEKAQETIDVAEAEELRQKMQDESFTLEDYLDQFRRMKKMGSMQSILEMIPGMKESVSPDMVDEKKLKVEEAIILSMTYEERRNHLILGPSRRKRIAKGSGRALFEVNQLLKNFEKMKIMMKKMTRNKNYQAQMMSRLEGLQKF